MKSLNIMKQAREMMAKLEKTKEEIAKRTETATVGGGMVTVTVRGDNRVVSVKIDPEVVDPDDVEMLEDLILSATNEALKKVQEMVAREMKSLTGGINLPGLM